MFNMLLFTPFTLRARTLLLACLSVIFVAVSEAQVVSPGAVEPQRSSPALPAPVDDSLIQVPTPSAREGGTTTHIDVSRIDVQPEGDTGGMDMQVTLDAEALAERMRHELSGSLSFAQLENIAVALTDFYRGQDLLLATAYLPAQDVVDGIVVIKVLPGFLESVAVENNDMYRSGTVRRPFEQSVGGPISTSTTETAMLRLNDMPGMRAAALFKPGEALGTSRLAISVEEEDPLDFSAQVDNYGVEATGEVRLLLGVDVNNISGHIDQLSVDAVKTFSSGDLKYGRVAYQITHPDLVHTLSLSHSETDYDVQRGQSALGIEGDTSIGEALLTSQWVRSRNFNLASRFGLALKRAEVEFSKFDFRQGVDKLSVFELGLVADHIDIEWRGIHRATLSYFRGVDEFIGSMDSNGDSRALRQGASGRFSPGDFDKLTASYMRLQSLATDHSLLLRLRGQYSDDLLSSLEQMSLGGPYTVRAYPVSEHVKDKGVFASLAWVINGSIFGDDPVYDDYSWADLLSVSVFFDYGQGSLNDPQPAQDKSVDIAGAGVELDLRFPKQNAFARLSVAAPTTNLDARNDEDFQYWIAIGANF